MEFSLVLERCNASLSFPLLGEDERYFWQGLSFASSRWQRWNSQKISIELKCVLLNISKNVLIIFEFQFRYLLYSICHPMLHISSQVKLEFPHRSFTSFTYSVCIFWQRTVLCAGQGYEIIILKLQRGKMILEYWF